MANKLEKFLFGKQLLELRKEERLTAQQDRDIQQKAKQWKKENDDKANRIQIFAQRQKNENERIQQLHKELLQEEVGDKTPEQVIKEIEHPEVVQGDKLEKAA